LRVLKSRLFEKIKDISLSDNYLENNLIFNESESITFSLKKKIFFIRTLHRTLNSGRTETITILLQEVITKAKKNECFEVLVEALIEKKYFQASRDGVTDFDEINKEIQFYEYCFKSVKNANDEYFRFISNDLYIKSRKKSEIEEHISKSIKKMEIDYKKTKAQQVRYYIDILKIIQYEKKEMYLEAIEILNNLLIIIKKSNVLYTKARIGFALSNLSFFHVLTHKFSKAIIYTRQALQLLIPSSLNFLIGKEQEFYVVFFSGDYKNALLINNEMIQHPKVSTGEFRQSIFFYQQACVHFMMKNYKDAHSLTAQSLKLEKDKTGWNIALRILIIMIFIELKKHNEASTSLATLRKHIDRNSKSKEVRARDILILKLLRELEKDGFIHNDKNKKASHLINELSEKNKPTSWNYYTPELIPFHKWAMTLPVKN
jgi:tetratricopeptide (TPR) repeat protein